MPVRGFVWVLCGRHDMTKSTALSGVVRDDMTRLKDRLVLVWCGGHGCSQKHSRTHRQFA